jgi:hypothetical protein
MIIDLGERLYETVKDTYDLRNVTKARAEWYKLILDKKNNDQYSLNQNLVS